MVTGSEVNEALKEEASVFYDESDVQEKKINLKMLVVDFIFNPKKNGGRTNFGDLAKVLAKAPESVLNTELVKTLVENFYNKYFYWIFGICYIPFVIYFLSASYFFSALIDQQQRVMLETSSDKAYHVSRFLTVILTLYFYVIISLQIAHRRIDFFLDT